MPDRQPFCLTSTGKVKILGDFRGKNLYDLALRVKIGQNYDPLLLDPTELRFQAKKRVALCDIVKDGLKIVRRKNG